MKRSEERKKRTPETVRAKTKIWKAWCHVMHNDSSDNPNTLLLLYHEYLNSELAKTKKSEREGKCRCAHQKELAKKKKKKRDDFFC